jgi:hypothetical protein
MKTINHTSMSLNNGEILQEFRLSKLKFKRKPLSFGYNDMWHVVVIKLVSIFSHFKRNDEINNFIAIYRDEWLIAKIVHVINHEVLHECFRKASDDDLIIFYDEEKNWEEIPEEQLIEECLKDLIENVKSIEDD